MQIFIKPASTLTALSLSLSLSLSPYRMHTDLELCACDFKFDFFTSVEGTYKFVGINERQVICFYFKNTKLTTNSTNTMCNISENYVACVDICNGVTLLYFLVL